jgi:hypothetical protein
MTTEFKPGMKVHVEFDAVVEEPNEYDYISAKDSNPYSSGGLYANSDYGYGFLKVRDVNNALYHYVWAGPSYNDDLVTVVHETDWEKHGGAQVGDIWEANGREYFTYKSFGAAVTLFPVDGQSGMLGYYSADQHDEFAALNPRLVRRRGEEI